MTNKPDLKSYSSLPPLKIQGYERYLPTAFDDSLSLLQKVNKVIFQLNKIGEISNDLTIQWNELMHWIIGNGLESIVEEIFDKRVNDGTFDSLIFKIVGNLTDLNTEDKTTLVSAINELYVVAYQVKNNIGELDDLETTAKETIVSAINEIKRTNDINNDAIISIGEATGYGIISGLQVKQQTVLAMAVDVGDKTTPNIVHMPNGVRYVIQSGAIAVDDSESSLNRIDSIYVNTDGEISYMKGVASQSPRASVLPENSVLLAHVNVVANDTTVNNSDIIDKREMKDLSNLLTDNKSNYTESINELFGKIGNIMENGIGNVDDLPTEDKSTIVNSIVELFELITTNHTDANTKLGNLTELKTLAKTNLVSAVNELLDFIFSESENTDNIIGDLSNLPTENKSNIVASIVEVFEKINTENAELMSEITETISYITDVKNDVGVLSELPTTDKRTVIKAITEVFYKIETATGNLTDLETESKLNLVSAINEIFARLADFALKSDVGDKNQLKTVSRGTLVSAINEVYDAVGEVDGNLTGLLVNVKAFGAVGDGVTDDTDAIQRAVTEIKNREGGILYFPKGNYITNKTIVLHNFTHLIGENSLSTFIKWGDNPVPTHNAMVVFRHATRPEHCDGISMREIHLHLDNKDTHGVLGFSVYDSVVFENVIVEGLVRSNSAFRLVPHEGLVASGGDVVSQTIIMDNCMAYANENEHNGSIFYFNAVQEMNIRGCKAFAGRDFPVTLRTLSVCFEFVDCRGIVCEGISVANQTRDVFPIKIRVDKRDSNGFVFIGTTVESCARILEVKGTTTHMIDSVTFISSRDEGSGGVNPPFHLENVTKANVEVLVGSATTINVLDSMVRSFNKMQYQAETFSLHDSGSKVFDVKFPWEALNTSLSLLVSDGATRKFQRVTIGAPDSGGDGYRALIIPN